MAASLLDRARREVEASPVEKDDESVGGVRSYWTWAFMLFLPLLFSSGFVVAAYLAGVVVGPAQVVKIALWNGNYQYLIPALVAVGGVLIIMWGITQVMDSVFDHSKHQGFILSGITIACLLVSAPVLMLMMGPAVYFSAFRNWLDVMMLAAIHTAFVAPVVLIYWWAWGTVFFRKAKRSMSILYTGIFTTQYGFLLLGCFTLYDANMLLPIVILHLSFIAQVVTTVGWLNITGYAGEEHWAHGLGSLLGLGIYPIVYGAMRWSKCKVWLIVYLIAWPMAIGTSLFASLGTAATNKIRSRIQADLAEARKQAAEAEAQK